MRVHDGLRIYDLQAEPTYAAVTHLAASALDAGDVETFLRLLPLVAQAEGLASGPPAPTASATAVGPVERGSSPPVPGLTPSHGCTDCSDPEAHLVGGQCRPCIDKATVCRCGHPRSSHRRRDGGWECGVCWACPTFRVWPKGDPRGQ